MNEYEPERLDIQRAAESLSEIWLGELSTHRKHWYKWCAVAVDEWKIYLYLDCKRLPEPFKYYGWEVIPVKCNQPKPLKTRKK
jgi:hypothetical protein